MQVTNLPSIFPLYYFSINPEILLEISKSLKVPFESIKNFSDDHLISIIFYPFNNKDNENAENQIIVSSILLTKLLNFLQKKSPYERMLKEKNEMMDRLEKMLVEKQV